MKKYIFVLCLVLLVSVALDAQAVSLFSSPSVAPTAVTYYRKKAALKRVVATKLQQGIVGQELSIDLPFDKTRVANLGIGCTDSISSYITGNIPAGTKLEPVAIQTMDYPTSNCALTGLKLTGTPTVARTYAFSVKYNTSPKYTVRYTIKIAKSSLPTTSNTSARGGSATTVSSSTDPSVSIGPKVYTDSELLALADDAYSDGNLPLGDKKYVTDSAKQGYVYFCNVPGGQGGGAGTDGPWIDGSTWNYQEKISVAGDVAWPSATFKNTVAGTTRTMTGNGLPINHNTGIFPIGSSDPAYQYDRNPNSIKSQTLSKQLPINPTYLSTPQCMGMEAGYMLSGVPLFGPFDAQLRDAMAHEVQDTWNGHPQVSGQYHYHGPTGNFDNEDITTVVGYALDGFPITGGRVAEGKYLTTSDLDECHGLTSTIMVDGTPKTTYHYVMTRDFPYSVSCFRGKPTSLQTGNGMQGGNQNGAGQRLGTVAPGGTGQTGSSGISGQQGGMPPQAAVASCSGKVSQSSCSFTTPTGTMSGKCGTPPGMTALACMPARPGSSY